jgi:hypothetical protein
LTDTTEAILARFESRQAEAATKPPRKFEPPPPPPKLIKRAPTDPQEIKLLHGACVIASRMAQNYEEKSAEYTALAVLINFTKDMIE